MDVVPQQGGRLVPWAVVLGMRVQHMGPGKQCSWTGSCLRRRCALM